MHELHGPIVGGYSAGCDSGMASKKQNVEMLMHVIVWDPPWSKDRMSEEALLELGLI